MSERLNVKSMLMEPEPSKERFASLVEAEAIMGDDFLGPQAIKEVFKIELEGVPPVPFSPQELERAKELDQQLILFVRQLSDYRGLTIPEMNDLVGSVTKAGDPLFATDLVGLTRFNQERFLGDVPRIGWRLVSKDVVIDTLNKTYLQQTEELITYLEKVVFASIPLPQQYRSAIAEFKVVKKKIAQGEVVFEEAMENLMITKLTRETLPEVVYRLILNERVYNRVLLPESKTWTKTRFDNGSFAAAGDFAGGGMLVKPAPSHAADPRRGVCFSRPGFFKPQEDVWGSTSPLPSQRNF